MLYIESTWASSQENDKIDKQERAQSRGSMKITGKLGDVMQESTMIAHTFAKNFCANVLKNERALKLLESKDIHIHFPEGAIPKDGPSAGIAITTSLLSLALDKPVAPHFAMTGEITLNGKVLPIGGVKEKIMSAVREDLTTLILPKSNKKEVLELSDEVKKGIKTFHFVEDYAQVHEII